ncbi:MAG: hypothetical protein CR982_00445 [Candidatus Cloacimonadota bacterium]|nr:MAG: hypothetical protein CR982_00445 [Candidatus Cloacimonadota bacterium]PIE78769.1 MAG: hypothetical protein CSA15_06205 [Candidatus Delongbacteria bacterium]
MKTTKINANFKKFGEWQIKNRYLLLGFILVILVIGLLGVPKIYMENDRESWFDNADAIKIATDKFEEQFGNNENIGILIESEDVFQPEVLNMMLELEKDLLDKVPYSDEVMSLANLEISIGNNEGIEVISPFKEGIPKDPKKLDEIRKLFLSRTSFVDKVVSKDSKETWMSLSLNEFPSSEEWKKEGNIDPLFQVGEAAIKVLNNPKYKSSKYTLKPVGMPYTETEERDFFGKEAVLRIVSCFVAMVILLIIFVRSFRGVIIPALTSILGTLVVFGILGHLKIGIDANMMTLPIMLGMALSVGYSIHLINGFKRFYRNSPNRREAVVHAVEETGWPLLFTAITTMGSVLSFLSTGIASIAWVGYTAAGIVFVNYLFVIILIPIFLSFGENRTIKEKERKKASFGENIMEKLGVFTLKRRRFLLFGFILTTLLLIPGIMKVEVNIDMFKMMGLKVEYIKRAYEVINSRLGSYMSYSITINYEEADKIKEPKVMENFDKLLKEIGKFPLTAKNENNSSIFSILDIIKDMNQTLNEDKKEFYKIPQSKEMIAQLLFLYELSGGTKLFNWVDEDFSILKAQIQMSKFDANETVRELNEIKKMGKQLFPNAEVSVIGTAVQFAEMNSKIVTAEMKSILVSFLIISILLILVFSSFGTGLIGMIPNLIPMAFIGGYMGYFDIPLDMMTMTIIPMVLGIAVDDTIHFINHIKYKFEKEGNYKIAIISSFKHVGVALAMTTIILSAGFAMYIFSPVAVMSRIGFLVFMGLTAALISDYLATPILIYMTKPFGKEKK